MKKEALPYILLLGLLWGTSLVATRFSVGQFHPTIFAGLRMLLASVAYLFIYLVSGRQRSLPRDSHLWCYAALLGIIGTAIPMTCIVSSVQYQSAAVTSILLTGGPIITVLMAHVFLGDEALTRRKGIGVIVALGGALLLAIRGESGLADVGQFNPLGYGLVFLGLLSAGGASIYARKFLRDLDTFDVASVRMFAATVAVMPLSALLVGLDFQEVNTQGVLALAYAALIGTSLAMGLSFYIIQRFGATASATALYVTPVTASLGGILLLDEKVTAGMTAGMGLIAVGISLINQWGSKEIVMIEFSAKDENWGRTAPFDGALGVSSVERSGCLPIFGVMKMFDFAVNERWKQTYPGAVVGILVMQNVSNPAESSALDERKTNLEQELCARYSDYDRATLRAIPTLQAYRAYYKRFRKSYHVQLQLESVALKGKHIPRVAALVEAMFMSELEDLLLTAGHDLDHVQPPLQLDIAQGDEQFVRLNGQEQILKANDMIISDAENVISSVIYGPDRRTRIRPETTRALFTTYAPVGIGEAAVIGHLEKMRDHVLLVEPAAGVEVLKVYW